MATKTDLLRDHILALLSDNTTTVTEDLDTPPPRNTSVAKHPTVI